MLRRCDVAGSGSEKPFGAVEREEEMIKERPKNEDRKSLMRLLTDFMEGVKELAVQRMAEEKGPSERLAQVFADMFYLFRRAELHDQNCSKEEIQAAVQSSDDENQRERSSFEIDDSPEEKLGDKVLTLCACFLERLWTKHTMEERNSEFEKQRHLMKRRRIES